MQVANAWGAQPAAPVQSLRDIMLEAEQEPQAIPAIPAAEPSGIWACPACTFDNSTAYSMCEICGTAAPAPETPEIGEEQQEAVPEQPQEVDDDLALALALQREELQQNEQYRSNSNSKVRVVSLTERELELAHAAAWFADQEDEEEEEDIQSAVDADLDDEHEFLGAWNHNHGAQTGISVRSHRVRSALYRDPTGALISKHDPDIAGRRNARQMDLDDGVRLNNTVYNSLRRGAARATNKGVSYRGRMEAAAHATCQGAMDPRTVRLLQKLVNAEVLQDVFGIVCSGKEASVLHATAPSPQGDVAVKLFRTTLNEFSNRADYVIGDRRFKGTEFTRGSSRRKIGVWAEKEANNLRRISRAGVPCPEFVARKEHVLVMSFVGTDGVPAPQLREVQLPRRSWPGVYTQVVNAMRGLYQQARLVHADLSEYNILYHNRQIVVIDVGQAVDTSHPRALEFLQRDCEVITQFFSAKGLGQQLMNVDGLMEVIVGPEE